MVPQTHRRNGSIMQWIGNHSATEMYQMKLIRYGLAAALALAVGITVPAFAQHDHGDDHGKDKDRHEKRDVRDRHEDHERHEAREHEDHGRHEGWERHEAREHEDHGRHEGWERHEAREHERPVVVERHYGRISEAHWHEHFGREHRFVIVRPVIVEGRSRFQYGGYWFVIGRPLPPGWRYTDEVYVDYIDGGYYMCSPVHPGVHISINIL